MSQEKARLVLAMIVIVIAQLTTTEVAVHDLEVVDADLRFAFGMASMEMREAVVVEEHRDRDPEVERRSRDDDGDQDRGTAEVGQAPLLALDLGGVRLLLERSEHGRKQVREQMAKTAGAEIDDVQAYTVLLVDGFE